MLNTLSVVFFAEPPTVSREPPTVFGYALGVMHSVPVRDKVLSLSELPHYRLLPLSFVPHYDGVWAKWRRKNLIIPEADAGTKQGDSQTIILFCLYYR